VSLYGGQKTYEVESQITIPEYRTDAARAIDAYERLMERHMDLTEGNFTRIGVDLRDVAKKLDSINSKLTELSTRIARIEKKLGIEQPKLLPSRGEFKKPQPKTLDKETQEKPSPSP
jgi:archaellum component FlaC